MVNDFPVIDTVATGARIKELRKEHHLKVSDVRSYMGFESDQAIYKWQRGESMPTIDNLYALSVLFKTSMDDILRGTKEETVEVSSSAWRELYILRDGNCLLFLPHESWFFSGFEQLIRIKSGFTH